MKKIGILFVCMGNICRSPTAEGVFRALLTQRRLSDLFEVDSAGTHAYHVGDAPDLRARKAARDRGIELKHLRARKVAAADFEKFDVILAMDSDNFSILQDICPETHKDKIKYLLDFAPQLNQREVPDPYYGGAYGFERVLDMAEAAAEGLLEFLTREGVLSKQAG
ncbi:low molecular weight protein-tyrosine-phosphatase [Methylomonas rhizoryzae]|uniref:low molecular weight protein-tyrosine-phosphatase n=1 Tax=Methylomonas rhizoryzae TaxID=2608981 RepID=UPI0012319314|nr:low molecular weight protein-tyrosine-phosphatase [Methylomonas rhizoryzae]